MEIWEEIVFDRERGAKRLVAELGDRLLTASFQITQNSADAEDLVFRTFSQVIAKVGQYDGRSAFFTWIYRILLNLKGAVSRRINIQHRLVYQVLRKEHVVKVLRMWTCYA